MLDNAGPEPPGSADGPHSAGVTVLFLSPATEFVGGAEQSLMDLVANPAIHAVVATPGHGALAERAAQLGAGLRTFSYGAIADVRRPFKMRSVLTSFRDSIRLARQLARIAGEEKAQIIHSNGLKVHVVACLARLFGAPPVFVHIRDIPYTRTEAMVWHLFQLLASRIILVSRACWPGKALPRQARIIHNGVHVPLTTLPDHPPGRPIAIGFLGRISPLKGLRMLVEWIAQCRTAGLDIRLIVRGGVQPNNADYFREVQNTVASHHLESICRFDDERHGLEAIYENVDVIAVPQHPGPAAAGGDGRDEPRPAGDRLSGGRHPRHDPARQDRLSRLHRGGVLRRRRRPGRDPRPLRRNPPQRLRLGPAEHDPRRPLPQHQPRVSGVCPEAADAPRIVRRPACIETPLGRANINGRARWSPPVVEMPAGG